MDKIIMKNLEFYGYHGVLEAEKELGQKFVVDIEMALDLDKASTSDAVKDTVSYADVYMCVLDIFESEKYDLIEKVAGEIIQRVFKKFNPVNKMTVEVKKPQAPVPGIYDYFSVRLERDRHE